MCTYSLIDMYPSRKYIASYMETGKEYIVASYRDVQLCVDSVLSTLQKSYIAYYKKIGIFICLTVLTVTTAYFIL